jgi:hypothetical protein
LNGNEESILDDKVDKGLQNVRIFYGWAPTTCGKATSTKLCDPKGDGYTILDHNLVG